MTETPSHPFPTSPPMHYLPPRGGSTHAFPQGIVGAIQDDWTSDPAKVTCEICRAHLPAASDA